MSINWKRLTLVGIFLVLIFYPLKVKGDQHNEVNVSEIR